MLTDAFFIRYPSEMVWSGDNAMPQPIAILFRQLTHLILEDLLPTGEDRERLLHSVHNRLAREMGVFRLAEANGGQTYQGFCVSFLATPYNLWDDNHRDADYFFKTRLSFVELIFREVERRETEYMSIPPHPKRGLLDRLAASTNTVLPRGTDVGAAIHELNARLRQAGLPLHYHNGYIQRSDHDLVAKQVSEPFWELLKDPKWTNVEVDMLEAIDLRDSQGRDPSLYAMKALESTIKIISDDKGWTTGNERGAANYIDNLVSKQNGRFLATWEAEILKRMFTEVRNPHGHGPGNAPLPSLSPQQISWVIDAAMTWIKSLIHRL